MRRKFWWWVTVIILSVALVIFATYASKAPFYGYGNVYDVSTLNGYEPFVLSAPMQSWATKLLGGPKVDVWFAALPGETSIERMKLGILGNVEIHTLDKNNEIVRTIPQSGPYVMPGGTVLRMEVYRYHIVTDADREETDIILPRAGENERKKLPPLHLLKPVIKTGPTNSI